jgi:hypothetical protein
MPSNRAVREHRAFEPIAVDLNETAYVAQATIAIERAEENVARLYRERDVALGSLHGRKVPVWWIDQQTGLSADAIYKGFRRYAARKARNGVQG